MTISIITVAYNNRFGLAETIKSVISQSYKNIEFIIIDGGSNDGSRSYKGNNATDLKTSH